MLTTGGRLIFPVMTTSAVSGRPIKDRRYYEVLALFKLGCIAEGSYYRHIKGVSDTALHADFEWIVPRLISTAYSITTQERD